MNTSPTDMTDVMRLTRAGRLQEATALIQTGLAGRPVPSGASRQEGGSIAPKLIDMQPPAAPGAGWSDTVGAPRRAETARSHPASARSPETRWSLLKKRFDLPGLRMKPRAPVPVPDGASFTTHQVRTESGALTYKVYVPVPRGIIEMPLVVMLHGCTQNPDDFAAGTRMNALAEAHGFLVAYPEQTRAANVSRCWNWFRTGDQTRDEGEPALIAAATRRVIDDHSVDRSRVFIAGLSAGGAAAAIMGCAYPDLFAGVGVHSGLACGAASDLVSAFAAMRGAQNGRQASSTRSRVPTIVFHGTADRTVAANNATAVAAQASGPADAGASERGAAADGTCFTRTVRRDGAGAIISETWMIDGAGHAWSGGSPAGSYTSPNGPDASREMLRFFGILKNQ